MQAIAVAAVNEGRKGTRGKGTHIARKIQRGLYNMHHVVLVMGMPFGRIRNRRNRGYLLADNHYPSRLSLANSAIDFSSSVVYS